MTTLIDAIKHDFNQRTIREIHSLQKRKAGIERRIAELQGAIDTELDDATADKVLADAEEHWYPRPAQHAPSGVVLHRGDVESADIVCRVMGVGQAFGDQDSERFQQS